MQSWPAPDVPALPGTGPRGAGPGHRQRRAGAGRPRARMARIYVCGITPYDATHLGHANTYVTFDLLNRAWRDAGVTSTTCRTSPTSTTRCSSGPTVTGEDWRELAARETELFREDMTALRVLPPEHYVGAVEAIPLIVEFIGGCANAALLRRGRRPLLPGRCRPGLRSGLADSTAPRCWSCFAERGGDPERPGKKDPLDALLWRAERPGEPSWESAVGRAGRAGTSSAPRSRWSHLGSGQVDVKGGGRDLVFPHHEMGASHGAGAHRARPVRACLRARRHGRLPGREDVQVARATWCSSPRCAAPASTPPRSDWPCWPTTTARLGVDAPTTSRCPGAARCLAPCGVPAGRAGRRRHPGRRPRRARRRPRRAGRACRCGRMGRARRPWRRYRSGRTRDRLALCRRPSGNCVVGGNSSRPGRWPAHVR